MYADNADAIVKGCCEIISQENVKAKRAIFIIHEDKNFHMAINDGNKIDAYESESPFDDPKEVGERSRRLWDRRIWISLLGWRQSLQSN